MPNKIQKFLFTASALSPLLICAAGVHWYKVGLTNTVISVGIIGILLFAYSPIFAAITIRILPPMRVTVVKTTEVDRKHSIAFTFLWFVSLTGIILKGEDIWLFVILGIIAGILMSLSNTCIPNICFLLIGYHYHEITTDNYEKPRYMLSKRSSITDAASIKKVITIFNDLWIEVL